jgi:type II secretory pathway component GspD/PulD (secretin)
MDASIIAVGAGTVNGIFRAIETKSDLDLISKPELLVVDKAIAEIKAGTQEPYQGTPIGNPPKAVNFKDVGVNMKMQPTIMPNNCVQLNILQLEVSESMRQKVNSVEMPVFSRRAQSGFVLVPSGQTLVVGGLSSRRVTKTDRRVPVLGKIPLLGIPFRRRESDAQLTNLLIFVSPTVVDLRNMSKEATSALEFWKEKGNDWKHSDDVKHEIKIMRDE